MKKIEITIDGKVYPCRPTMGAMLRFKRETGRELNEAEGLSDMCTYLWCCIVSASKHDGISFDMPLMDFADGIGTEDLQAWTEAVNAEQGTGEDGEKKSR